MEPSPQIIILATTIVFALVVAISEIHEQKQRRSSAKRYSTKVRAFIYATLYAVTLTMLLFPSIGNSFNRVGTYAAAAAVVLELMVVVLFFVLARVGTPALNRTFQEGRELANAGRTLEAIPLMENNRAKERRWG